MKLEIITTQDGSPTLHLPNLDEHYHSTFGARTESQHIFVQEALGRRLANRDKDCFQLLEIGFGTGLNALLTLLHHQSSPHPYTLKYITYELYPLEENLITQLFSNTLSPSEWAWMQQLHQATWNQEVEIVDGFTLHKIKADLTESPLIGHNDIIYMDAFAPEKTPELWKPTFLQTLFSSASSGGWLSTYCAKGIVRRNLQAAGFEVHRLPGPPHGKREILAAHKP